MAGHLDGTVLDVEGEHRRRRGRIGAGRAPGVQQARSVHFRIEHLVGVSGDRDRVRAAFLARGLRDPPFVRLEVAGPVRDDERRTVDLEHRGRGEAESRVYVPGHCGQLLAREVADLLERFGRVEVTGVDDAVRVSDFLAYPLRNLRRSRRDVCIAEYGNVRHGRRFDVTPGNPFPARRPEEDGVASRGRSGSAPAIRLKRRRAEFPDMDETHVVTCFLREEGAVLALRRSEAVGSYAGKWGAVAGHAEGDPDGAARREIAEETGIDPDDLTFVRGGEPFPVEDSALGTRWIVHPYLFDAPTRSIEPNYETAAYEWLPPTQLRRRETVPDLWASYERVAPTVETVREDADHGSAYLSVRALEVLRDRAGVLATSRRGTDAEGDEDDDRSTADAEDWTELTGLATALLNARPSMAALRNRVNRAMATAAGITDRPAGEPPNGSDDRPAGTDERTARALESAAIDGIERAVRVDREAGAIAAERIDGSTVLTLSRSGTVRDALEGADRVFVAESRPAREGVGVAESLAEAGVAVTLHTDAAIAHVLAEHDIDAVLVGADTVLPDGRVVNKTGTRSAALAAAHEGLPCYVVAATDKVSTDERPHLETGPPEALYDGDATLDTLNPTFDVTPGEFVSAVRTERGALDVTAVGDVADELRTFEAWQE